MSDLFRNISRRTFLGASGLAAAGLSISGCAARANFRANSPGAGKSQSIDGKSVVSLIKNSDRRKATYDSLKPLQNEVSKAIGQKQVIIKVNAGFPSEEHRIHSTYADQVRGILDFLADFYEGSIWISEGVGSSKTGDMMDGYELYGILPIPKEYKSIKLVDANRTPATRKWNTPV